VDTFLFPEPEQLGIRMSIAESGTVVDHILTIDLYLCDNEPELALDRCGRIGIADCASGISGWLPING
jgi:hypothetical protein